MLCFPSSSATHVLPNVSLSPADSFPPDQLIARPVQTYIKSLIQVSRCLSLIPCLSFLQPTQKQYHIPSSLHPSLIPPSNASLRPLLHSSSLPLSQLDPLPPSLSSRTPISIPLLAPSLPSSLSFPPSLHVVRAGEDPRGTKSLERDNYKAARCDCKGGCVNQGSPPSWSFPGQV